MDRNNIGIALKLLPPIELDLANALSDSFSEWFEYLFVELYKYSELIKLSKTDSYWIVTSPEIGDLISNSSQFHHYSYGKSNYQPIREIGQFQKWFLYVDQLMKVNYLVIGAINQDSYFKGPMFKFHLKGLTSEG